MAISNEQIERINALAAKNKTPEGLTAEEVEERKALRELYLDSVRASLRAQVESVKLVDEAGNDVTPEKLKKVQREKGMRE
ncbi:DUF896 domain-containing protein [Lactococcus termiticola]|uniref:UPF0291 protein NtB2_00518 n=1 Tax=Lactococcus termiticola TaxID=2169526 RepID=A0A2R5HEY9_9LACT|nr:DUF896 domain-containing protein [Lactococcus termiticola]GBG96406.1 hypothetical protein NtB2_00518 [Lactococcus termiticola]